MGINEGVEGAVGTDAEVGTIVWVRRRNGSWWPGRILGTEELPPSHIMTPRSGTPVKLLGREDASVDWYNLEKSKRVKAFRCGEFDDCIERAETSQGVPSKKREKYARREDAILHALELEKELLDKKRLKLGISLSSVTNKAPSLRKDMNRYSPAETCYGNDGARDQEKFANSKKLHSGKIDSSLDEAGTGSYSKKGKPGKLPGWDDEISDIIPRMRGLQDFGLKIAPSKRKLPSSSSDGPHMVPVEIHLGSSKGSLAIKRKRSHSGLVEDSLVKRRDRRRPLVQVLQSSAKLQASPFLQSNSCDLDVPVQEETNQMNALCRARRSKCIYLPPGLDDENPPEQLQMSPTQFGENDSLLPPVSLMGDNASSGLIDAEETYSTECDYSDQDTEEETTLLSDTSYMPHMEDHSEQIAGVSDDVGVSKWHMKGKRNIRNLPKKSMDVLEERNIVTVDKCNGSIHGTRYDSKRNRRSKKPFGQGHHRSDDFDYEFTDDDLIEDMGHPLAARYGNGRYPSSWEADGLSQAHRGYWDAPNECFDPHYASNLNDGLDTMLVDVDLKVQTSYQGERVPLVSLMSRLNGKAIVGHPIQVEIMEDGSSDLLLTGNEFGYEPADTDENTTLPPVWRTARRTVMQRIPRPHPASVLEGEEADPPQQYTELDIKPLFKKQYGPHIIPKSKSSKKGSNHMRHPVTGKFLKKSKKKASLSNQKTRTLSSIAIEHKLRNNGVLGGLIKQEGNVPLVTCIPVKLVFSRILESIGRQPSKVVTRNPS
ncbi:hypothetical protein QJS04_geneDACA012210 [Acorus gramineus]|uniref:PWWP domain-containing protein n=1 Tax=Acorus gramineus TaxID=55184 RepID=A0AAV9BAB3_ACOGR|nr:hypothetical protein QJS04_geneDACA012210 [Acorus gramineus]